MEELFEKMCVWMCVCVCVCVCGSQITTDLQVKPILH